MLAVRSNTTRGNLALRQKARGNHNLHNLAQELFNNNIAENTCRSSGWRSASLLDIAEYLNGLAMQKYPAINGEFSLPVLKIKELGQQACDANSDRCTESIPDQFIVKDGDIIFSWSGTLLVDFWCGGKCGLNQHLKLVLTCILTGLSISGQSII